MKRRMKTNVKRMLVLTLALALAAAPAAGCAKKSSNEAEQIKASGVFRVAIVNTGSRYMYMAGDTPMGVEPALAKYIGDALGAEVQYQVTMQTLEVMEHLVWLLLNILYSRGRRF